MGKDVGSLKVDANADVNFALFGDTVRLAARGFFHSVKPSFYYRHYHAKHYWWDNDDLSKIIHSRVEGVFTYEKTNTTLRVAFDNLKNYTYFTMSYDVDADTKARTANTVRPRQSGSPISLLTLSLEQNFKLGPLHWGEPRDLSEVVQRRRSARARPQRIHQPVSEVPHSKGSEVRFPVLTPDTYQVLRARLQPGIGTVLHAGRQQPHGSGATTP